MIEGQQATLNATGGEAGLVDIASDAARVHMRRVLARMAEASTAK